MRIKNNVSLSTFNTFKIDARARQFLEIEHEHELHKIIPSIKDKFTIIGGGSNILLTSNQLGTVIKNSIKSKKIISETDTYVLLEIGAGENWHETVMWAIDQDYGGIENLALIPGNVGAAPMQNIGAYGVELKDVFHSLWAYDIERDLMRSFHKNECEFGYRESIFKHGFKNKLIITKVILQLSKSNNHVLNLEYGAISKKLNEKGISSPKIRDIAEVVIDIRKSKLPDPNVIGNAGSFFKNPIIDKSSFLEIQKSNPSIVFYPIENSDQIKIPAGWLIEQCGWKGKKVGQTGCYKNQALVLVNHGKASGAEILEFAHKVSKSVLEKFGIKISPEVNIID